MKDHKIKYVLKLISKDDINFQNLKEYYWKSPNKEIHYYSINENVSGNFDWKTVINIVIDNNYLGNDFKNLELKYNIIKNELLKSMNLNVKNTICELYKQYYFGDELAGKNLIISFYSMNNQRSKIEKEEIMIEHLDMEKQQNLYKLVHFNQIMNESKNSNQFEFVFESYLEDPSHINNLYNQDFIEIMRRHSEGFLDVTTRRLAFGQVKILNEKQKLL